MKMIGQLLIPLFALVALAAGSPGITQYKLDGSNLISTSGSNFGLTDASFAGRNWKTVSINGNQMTIYSDDCNSRFGPIEQLTGREEELIKETVKRIVDGEKKTIFNGGTAKGDNSWNMFGSNHRASNLRSGSLIVGPNSGNAGKRVEGNNKNILNSNRVQTGPMLIGPTKGQGGGYSQFSNNGISLQKTDEFNYSIAQESMPYNLARVFVNGDVLTYVYGNGRVMMKPIDCLQSDEQILLSRFEGQVENEKEEFLRRL